MKKWFSNLKIVNRLLMGFFVVLAMAAIIGMVGIVNIKKIVKADKEMFSKNTLGVAYSGDAYSSFQRIRYNVLKLSMAETEEDRDKDRKDLDSLIKQVDDLAEKYQGTIASEDNQKQFDSAKAMWGQYRTLLDEVIPFAEKGDIKSVKEKMLVQAETLNNQMMDAFLNLMTISAKEADATSQSNTKMGKQAELIVIAVCIAAFIISIITGIINARSISVPINNVVDIADKVALGDVNVKVETDRKDEIGTLLKAFGKMIENIRSQARDAERIADGDYTVDVEIRSEKDLLGNKLSELVSKNNEVLSNVVLVANQVAAGSKQLSQASMTLSEGATEQASAIEELTASIEQIASQIQANAQNANQADKLSVSAKDMAVQGNTQMREMLEAMNEINEASANISKVIKVIDDIAFQTNILALNAAVEAARAGQHGKGFAVVAEEVRNLAARSASAAKETTEMIEGSIERAERGTKIADDTADALGKIVEMVDKVAGLIAEIAVASNEQSMGIGQVNQGIMQVSQVVQANSATSEESAASSEELSSQAMILKDSVSRFKLKDNGDVF